MCPKRWVLGIGEKTGGVFIFAEDLFSEFILNWFG